MFTSKSLRISADAAGMRWYLHRIRATMPLAIILSVLLYRYCWHTQAAHRDMVMIRLMSDRTTIDVRQSFRGMPACRMPACQEVEHLTMNNRATQQGPLQRLPSVCPQRLLCQCVHAGKLPRWCSCHERRSATNSAATWGRGGTCRPAPAQTQGHRARAQACKHTTACVRAHVG